MLFANHSCEHIAVENPVGYMNTHYRKPDQIINPYQFGDPYRKKTCLWLKGLPLLIPTNELPPPEPVYYMSNGKPVHWCDSIGFSKDRAKIRSKTFPGIAKAMATQWSKVL